jgi:hypothetical protein
MNVISHRGYWLEPGEKNTAIAFRRSFELGFGTETDVRDCAGRLVISHDMPAGGEMGLEEFLGLVGASPLPLAINIKSDGLALPLAKAMAGYERRSWFVFDMSVPDMRSHIYAGNPVYTRMSEVEQQPAWLDASDGVWLDAFEGQWYDNSLVRDVLGKGKSVCIVSPELHRREHLAAWESLRPLARHDGLTLCTDLPEAARDFFGDNSR